MSIISQLRGQGATVELSASGGINLKSAPAALVAQVKDCRDDVVAALRAEAFGGITYEHSAFRYQLERVCDLLLTHKARNICADVCDKTVSVLWEIEEIAVRSIEAGAKEMIKMSGAIQLALGQIEDQKRGMLGGQALHQAVKEIFGTRKVDASAFGATPAVNATPAAGTVQIGATPAAGAPPAAAAGCGSIDIGAFG